MAIQIQLRGATLGNWTLYNPILLEREMVVETDTRNVKIGNGIQHYLDLPYSNVQLSTQQIANIAQVSLERTERISADSNLQSQISSISSGFLGTIAHNAVAAPTPEKSGFYEFSTSGTYPVWLPQTSPVTVNVNIGDKVSVSFVSSVYTYSYIAINPSNLLLTKGTAQDITAIKNFTVAPIIPNPTEDMNPVPRKFMEETAISINVTVKFPLEAGLYYTAVTARLAVPIGVRKKGLYLIYETSAGIWINEQYLGNSFTSEWFVDINWVNKIAIQDSTLLKKIGVLPQTFTEAEKQIGRNNLGLFAVESAFIKLGLQNPTAFFISDLAYKAASAISNLTIDIDDTLAILADIRVTGVFCGASNPTSTLIIKDFTTGTICQLNRTSGVNTGIVTLSGSSADNKIKVVAVLNLDKLIYANDFIFYQNNNTASAKMSFTKFSDVLQKKSELSLITKSIIEDSFIKQGLLNKETFFVGDDTYKIAQAIEKIDIQVDDSISAAADIRLYGVWNSSANLTTTVVVKDWTSGKIAILIRVSDTRTGLLSLSGQDGTAMLKVSLTINMDRIPYPFDYYQGNNTSSAKMSFTKFSDVLQKKSVTDAETLARSNADISLSDRINAIVSTAMSYADVSGVAESVNGYYKSWETGFAASSLYMSKKFPVTQGKSYYASSRVSGSAVALAVYMNGSTFISAQFVGVNTGGYIQYTRQLLTLPATATHVGITSFGSSVYYGNLEEIVFDAISPNELTTILLGYSQNSKVGEKALLVGTSIPWQGVETGDSYPQLLASTLGMTMYNEAVGSSCVRAGGNNTGTTKFGLFKGLHCAVLLKALSHTIAEKQQIMDKWQSGLDLNGNIFVGGTYGYRDFQLDYLADWASSFTSAEILGFSYENKIIKKYFDSTSPTFVAKPKYLFFDHGHNDLVQDSYDVSEAAAIAVPAVRNDRTTFIGAMNYIIDEVLKYDARQEVLFIGHYENARKPRIYKAQENLFDYWDYPSFKTWEKLGWSQQIVQTTGYWSSGVWIPSGGSLQSLTITQIWMFDNLHPATLTARQYYANKLIGWFKTL